MYKAGCQRSTRASARISWHLDARARVNLRAGGNIRREHLRLLARQRSLAPNNAHTLSVIIAAISAANVHRRNGVWQHSSRSWRSSSVSVAARNRQQQA